MQSEWEAVVRESLVADGANEAVDAATADAGVKTMASGGVGATMVHGGAGFDASAEAIEDDATDFALKDSNQCRVGTEVFGGAMDGGCELTLQAVGKAKHFLQRGAFRDDGTWAENFAAEFFIAFEHIECGGEDSTGCLRGVVVRLGSRGADFFQAADRAPDGRACLPRKPRRSRDEAWSEGRLWLHADLRFRGKCRVPGF